MPSRPHRPAKPARITGRSVLTGQEAREAIQHGLGQMALLLRPTLGPTARTVAIAPIAGSGAPEVLDHAGLIARRMIALEGNFANMGAMLLRQLVWGMHETAGDGGATAAVIAHHLLDRTVAYAGAGGDLLAVRRGIVLAAGAARDTLRSLARPVYLPAEIGHVVANSLHDPATSRLIGEALEEVGADGVIQVRDGYEQLAAVEYVEGVRWNGGPASRYFLPETATRLTLEHPLILVADHALTAADDVLPAVELCVAAGQRPLLVIAPEIQGAALALLLANRDHDLKPRVLAVKAPSATGQQPRAIEDIAVLVGARVFSRARGDAASDLTIASLGSARQAWATTGQAGLLGGGGSRAARRARLAEVQRELERADSDDAREKIRERIGRLAGVAAIVRVSGRTESERQEQQQRVTAAIAAGRAALRGGVVPGGGVSLVAAARAIAALGLTGEEAVGARFLAGALEEPLRVMASNAGLSAPSILHAARSRAPGEAFDLLGQQWVDPWQSGLVDPLLVLLEALERSVSLVGTAMMIETMVRGPQPEVSLAP